MPLCAVAGEGRACAPQGIPPTAAGSLYCLHAPGSGFALQLHDFPGVSGFWRAHMAFWTRPLHFLEKSASGEGNACGRLLFEGRAFY